MSIRHKPGILYPIPPFFLGWNDACGHSGKKTIEEMRIMKNIPKKLLLQSDIMNTLNGGMSMPNINE